MWTQPDRNPDSVPGVGEEAPSVMTHNGPDSTSRAMRGINAVMEGAGGSIPTGYFLKAWNAFEVL